MDAYQEGDHELSQGTGTQDDAVILSASSFGSRICWFQRPDEPLSIKYFLSMKGVDHLLLYSWILKDLAWMQGWHDSGMVFGSFSVILTLLFLVGGVVVSKEIQVCEVFHCMSHVLWIFANFWWMSGELYNLQYEIDDDNSGWYPVRTLEASFIFRAALCWLGVYYLIIKPIELLRPNVYWHVRTTEEEMKNNGGHHVIPRFHSFFKNFDQYKDAQ